MLSPEHIFELEKRWKKWKLKRLMKLFLSLFVLIIAPCLIYSAYQYMPFDNKKNELTIKKEQTPLKEEEQQLVNSADEPPKLSIQSLPPSTYTPKPKTVNKLSTPKTEEIALEPEDVAVKEINEAKEVAPNPEETVAKKSSKPKNEDTIVVENRPKIHIDMQPVDRNSINYLKEKFDSTGNVIFALMVAEEYYANNEYQNALRWALTANEINPKNEKSWMIFAMSKAKLNLPDEGIMALEEYLKNNNSGKIESLLISLKRGTFQ